MPIPITITIRVLPSEHTSLFLFLIFIRKDTLATEQDPPQSAFANFFTKQDPRLSATARKSCKSESADWQVHSAHISGLLDVCSMFSRSCKRGISRLTAESRRAFADGNTALQPHGVSTSKWAITLRQCIR